MGQPAVSNTSRFVFMQPESGKGKVVAGVAKFALAAGFAHFSLKASGVAIPLFQRKTWASFAGLQSGISGTGTALRQIDFGIRLIHAGVPLTLVAAYELTGRLIVSLDELVEVVHELDERPDGDQVAELKSAAAKQAAEKATKKTALDVAKRVAKVLEAVQAGKSVSQIQEFQEPRRGATPEQLAIYGLKGIIGKFQSDK